MINVRLFYDHFILWTFGIVCGHLLCFSHFGMFRPRKIWQPWSALVYVVRKHACLVAV
jgi:hypothetical protein